MMLTLGSFWPMSAYAERLKVVTSFTILADMAAQVTGDAADVVSITKPGAEIHGYQPTPGDLRRAIDADLILWNGLHLEIWFQQFLDHLGEVPSVRLTKGIEPIPIKEGASMGQSNPHAWMGQETAMIYIDNIEGALRQYDPKNAALYAANAAAYKDKIKAVMAPLADQLAALPEDQRWLVTCEGAFSYLARDLG
ncbi:MAG: zinc ABC transporter substrate-binding protein, partial [Alphaproteobacteria bacterium]